MVMKGDDDALLIHSFAHGNGIYFLRHDLRSAEAAFAQGPAEGKVDHALAILGQAELEEDELEEFVTLVSKTAGVGMRPLKARIKKERAERKAKAREASMESKTDGRIVRPRPEPDGELSPIVTFLDDVLVADQSEEPPMRNASGALVQIEVKQPWSLHTLTADSANTTREEAEAMTAPPEPVLVELTPTGVELLLENYVRWIVYTHEGSYFGALPSAHIKALDGVFQERATRGPRDQHRSPRHLVGSGDRGRWTRSGYRAGPPHRSRSARVSARWRTDGGGDQAVLGLPFG
jgi:hypothetical protein